jgi:hypothetical protein
VKGKMSFVIDDNFEIPEDPNTEPLNWNEMLDIIETIYDPEAKMAVDQDTLLKLILMDKSS